MMTESNSRRPRIVPPASLPARPSGVAMRRTGPAPSEAERDARRPREGRARAEAERPRADHLGRVRGSSRVCSRSDARARRAGKTGTDTARSKAIGDVEPPASRCRQVRPVHSPFHRHTESCQLRAGLELRGLPRPATGMEGSSRTRWPARATEPKAAGRSWSHSNNGIRRKISCPPPPSHKSACPCGKGID